MMAHVCRPGHPTKAAPGPADLRGVGAGDVVILTGALAEGDVARWAGVVGAAAMRGAEVRSRVRS